MDRKYKSEGTIREIKSKLSIAEDELHRTKTELSNLRKDNADLGGNFHEKDKLVNQLKTRVAVLEQEVKDKDSLLSKTSDMLQTEQHQKVCRVWKVCSQRVGKANVEEKAPKNTILHILRLINLRFITIR